MWRHREASNVTKDLFHCLVMSFRPQFINPL